MGCDIHAYLEVKDPETGKWEYHEVDREWHKAMTVDIWSEDFYNSFYTGRLASTPMVWDSRNYYLFTALAGVRDREDRVVEPISLPRGLPHDVSPHVRGESNDWSLGGHSHSWVTTLELTTYQYRNHEYLRSFYEWTVEYMKRFDEARLVFWFDN